MTREASAEGTQKGSRSPPLSGPAGAAVIALPVHDGDEALVAALLAGHPGARASLFERHAAHVRRVLIRVLGLDQDVPDLLQDVFLAALSTIQKLEDPRALRGWLTSIAVHHARALIRKRTRRRILRFVDPEELHGQIGRASGLEQHEAVRALYRILGGMPADERIAFALRFVDGMDLYEVAAACRVSRATVSRRLQRAEERFRIAAAKYEALAEWVEGGARWNR
jgi:RNA polymerase sigma-70 factor (ECF subfamily)